MCNLLKPVLKGSGFCDNYGGADTSDCEDCLWMSYKEAGLYPTGREQ